MFSVPVPWPPPTDPHWLQEMSVTVMAPLAHPIVSFVGRMCAVDPGPQDNTPGNGVTVVEGEVVVLVDGCAGVVETPLLVAFVVGGEDWRPTIRPTAIPTPRAERTSTTMPARTTVRRRTVMSRGSLYATKDHGSAGQYRKDERIGPVHEFSCPRVAGLENLRRGLRHGKGTGQRKRHMPNGPPRHEYGEPPRCLTIGNQMALFESSPGRQGGRTGRSTATAL